MTQKIKDILKICSVVLLLAGFTAVFLACRSGRNRITCNDVRVIIRDSSRLSAVSADDVKNYLKAYGTYIGQRIDSVNLSKIEDILDQKSAIRKSEAYMTRDGYLNILISQREPVVRFLAGNGRGFYADSEGYLFTLQAGIPPLVPVMDGSIPVSPGEEGRGEPGSDRDREWLAGVIEMVNYMKRSKVWAENIAQMTVRPDGDIVMIAREGKERFIFGGPERAEDKFRRMREYYEYILPEKGEGYYSTVNLKFDGQIVCRK